MNKLALGTVQFGLDYGISNNSGQISVKESKEILMVAKENQINTLDTAISYGESEAVLGEIGVSDFNLITKLPTIPNEIEDLDKWVKQSIKKSLKKLGVDHVAGLLVHNSEDFLSEQGDDLFKSLQSLKREGIVQKIGVSIYQPEELEKLCSNYHFDIVQAPFNIFDRRLIESGWLKRFKDLNIELHVRSVFLQGLLLMKNVDRPQKFSQWNILWQLWDDWLLKNNLTPVQACLGYVLSFSEISKVIVGVDSQVQLEDIIEATRVDMPVIPKDLYSTDVGLLNPSNWDNL
jgi:aryl-alcohol dehydrogenase-like predicted oxidoreductase